MLEWTVIDIIEVSQGGLGESGRKPKPSCLWFRSVSGVREGLIQFVFVMDMKIMVLDEFKEELCESKAISLAYEDGLDEL